MVALLRQVDPRRYLLVGEATGCQKPYLQLPGGEQAASRVLRLLPSRRGRGSAAAPAGFPLHQKVYHIGGETGQTHTRPFSSRLVTPRAPAQYPVRQAPRRAKNRVVQHGKQNLRGALSPWCSVHPGEWQPAGPPHTPGEQPERRAHGGFLPGSSSFPAQEAEGGSGSYSVGEVRRHGQEATGSGR
jgi:hypothetical protein